MPRIVVSRTAVAVARVLPSAWEPALDGLTIIRPDDHPLDGILAAASHPAAMRVVLDDNVLADATGFQPNTVYKALLELERLGAVSTVGRRTQQVRVLVCDATHWLWVAIRDGGLR